MMKHEQFDVDQKTYNTAILIRTTSLKKPEIIKHYITPLAAAGVEPTNIISFSLAYNDKGKCPISLVQPYLEQLLKTLESFKVKTLFVADVTYFKRLTKTRKAEPHFGCVLSCKIENYEHMKVILTVSYKTLFYNPAIQSRLDLSIKTLVGHINGNHASLGANIIHSEYYPKTLREIEKALADLHKHPVLACDIETFGLQVDTAGLGSISFAWNQHEGIAFLIDLDPDLNDLVRSLLTIFFERYKGKLIYHGGTFDIKMLIWNLYMNDSLDIKGMLYGLDVMYKNVEDTKIVIYLATNTTAGNHLSLKHNALEYAGNYAQEDIADIRKIPTGILLKYNLMDSLSTWYVHNKYYPILVQDQQEHIYRNIMLPSMKVVTQMELTGMPLDAWKVEETHIELEGILEGYLDIIKASQIVQEFETNLRQETMVAKNLTLKVKVKPLSDFDDVVFNPNSNKQLGNLLHKHLNIPVMETTDTGMPAVGGPVLKKILAKLVNEFNLTEEEISNEPDASQSL